MAPYAREQLYAALLRRFAGASLDAPRTVILSLQTLAHAHRLWRMALTVIEKGPQEIMLSIILLLELRITDLFNK